MAQHNHDLPVPSTSSDVQLYIAERSDSRVNDADSQLDEGIDTAPSTPENSERPPAIAEIVGRKRGVAPTPVGTERLDAVRRRLDFNAVNDDSECTVAPAANDDVASPPPPPSPSPPPSYETVELSYRENKSKQPTRHTYVYNNSVVNMEGINFAGSPGARSLLISLYNTFVRFVKYQDSANSVELSSSTKLTLVEIKEGLRQLESTNYLNAHLRLPDMATSLLTSMERKATTTQMPVFINQMMPLTCIEGMKNSELTRLQLRSMLARVKNGSNFIEINFSNPFRFVLVGVTRQQTGEHPKTVVELHRFFGDYINLALKKMYDHMYAMVNQEVARRQSEIDMTLEAVAPTAGNQNTENDSKSEKLAVDNFLRNVSLPLNRKDTVDIIVTTGQNGPNSKQNIMCYLYCDESKESLGMLRSKEEVSTNIVAVSSYVRPRILIDGTFSIQIYTRLAMQLSGDSERPASLGGM